MICRLAAVWLTTALVAGALFSAGACRRRSVAGRTASGSETCEQFCRLAVQPDEVTRASCRDTCVAQLHFAGDACQPSLSALLACRTAYESRPKLPGERPATGEACDQERGAAERCVDACGTDGIVRSGERYPSRGDRTHPTSYEIRHHGCGTCSVERGQPTGARCESAKACGSICIGCRGRQGLHDAWQSSVSVRACIDQRCAGRAELDALAPRLPELTECL